MRIFEAPGQPRAVQVESRRCTLLGAGVVALVLQQIADVTVGLVLRGISLPEQFGRFATSEGAIYAGLLILFAIMPVLANRPSQS